MGAQLGAPKGDHESKPGPDGKNQNHGGQPSACTRSECSSYLLIKVRSGNSASQIPIEINLKGGIVYIFFTLKRMTKATHDSSSSFNSTQSFEPSRKASSSHAHTQDIFSTTYKDSAFDWRYNQDAWFSWATPKTRTVLHRDHRGTMQNLRQTSRAGSTGWLLRVNSECCSSSPSSASMEQLLLLTILMCTWPISYTSKSTVCKNVNIGKSTFKEISRELC